MMKSCSKQMRNRLEQTIKQNQEGPDMTPLKKNNKDIPMLYSKLVDFAIREAYFIICPHYQQFEKKLNQIQNGDAV